MAVALKHLSSHDKQLSLCENPPAFWLANGYSVGGAFGSEKIAR
ncbi:hypothetical protein BVI434_1230047 [Burkholderia vietnamiensis]|nr:hypothetical protein BVI434_1230047 [Burkholderia vietnamiensis]